MTRAKRGRVHFCNLALPLRTRCEKWTCPLFADVRTAGKGDRSIFWRRRSAGSILLRKKNGPVPFSGFTLLEVILALAILAGSLAALGEVMRLADRNAELVRDESQAQILAASVMDELIAGARAATAVNGGRLDVPSDIPWLYWVEFGTTNHVEMLAVRVRVEQDVPAHQDPARFELVRWVLNPDYLPTSTGTEQTSSSEDSSSAFGAGGNVGGGGQQQ